jgi:predicted PolB exonuclease-like 3'-5' exonuclease
MVATGRLEELAGYCDTDIFVTYLLFLRFSLVTGGINLDYYASSLEHLHQHIGIAFRSDLTCKNIFAF